MQHGRRLALKKKVNFCHKLIETRFKELYALLLARSDSRLRSLYIKRKFVEILDRKNGVALQKKLEELQKAYGKKVQEFYKKNAEKVFIINNNLDLWGRLGLIINKLMKITTENYEIFLFQESYAQIHRLFQNESILLSAKSQFPVFLTNNFLINKSKMTMVSDVIQFKHIVFLVENIIDSHFKNINKVIKGQKTYFVTYEKMRTIPMNDFPVQKNGLLKILSD